MLASLRPNISRTGHWTLISFLWEIKLALNLYLCALRANMHCACGLNCHPATPDL